MIKPELDVISNGGRRYSMRYSELKEVFRMNGENNIQFTVYDDVRAGFIDKGYLVILKGKTLQSGHMGDGGYYIISEVKQYDDRETDIISYTFTAESIITAMRSIIYKKKEFFKYDRLEEFAGYINYDLEYVRPSGPGDTIDTMFNFLDIVYTGERVYSFSIARPEEITDTYFDPQLESDIVYDYQDAYSIILDLLSKTNCFIKSVKVFMPRKELPYFGQKKDVFIEVGYKIPQDYDRFISINKKDIKKIEVNEITGYPIDGALLKTNDMDYNAMIFNNSDDFYFPEIKILDEEEYGSFSFKNSMGSQYDINNTKSFSIDLKNVSYDLYLGDFVQFYDKGAGYMSKNELQIASVEKNYVTGEQKIEVGHFLDRALY